MSKPLLDPWRDAFVLELRLLEAPGTAIGDALAQVDAHCRESGETPEQAFGDPSAYATAMAEVLPRVPAQRRVRWWRVGLLAFATAVGLSALFSGTAGLRRGTVEISSGSLVAGFAGAVVIAVIAANLQVLMGSQAVLRRAGAIGALAVVAAWPPALFRQTFLTLSPAWAVLVFGVVALALTWGPQLILLRRDADPVLDPTTGGQPFSTPGR